LNTLGGGNIEIYGINNLDQVVGGSSTSAGVFHAFLWDKNDGIQDLGIQTRSVAMGINNLGQVVGQFYPGNNSHAFLWENGVFTDLGTFGKNASRAFDINDNSQIIGDYWGSPSPVPIPSSLLLLGSGLLGLIGFGKRLEKIWVLCISILPSFLMKNETTYQANKNKKTYIATQKRKLASRNAKKEIIVCSSHILPCKKHI